MSKYALPLSAYTLEELRLYLEDTEMLPSRAILKEDIPGRFAILADEGITNLADLIRRIKTKDKRAAFSEKTGLPTDYLNILRREAEGWVPKPVYFRDIPGVNPGHVEKLATAGIKSCRALFDAAHTPGQRSALAAEADIPHNDLLELLRLADLARVKGMGPGFVRLFFTAGVDSIETLAEEDPDDLFKRLYEAKAALDTHHVVPGMPDVRNYIRQARRLAKAIQW